MPVASTASSSSSLASSAPSMPIAASVPSRQGPMKQKQPMIQRALTGGAVLANASEHSQSEHSESTNPEAQDPGASAHEIGLLANEVWSLLKRKIKFEAELLGKRF